MKSKYLQNYLFKKKIVSIISLFMNFSYFEYRSVFLFCSEIFMK